MKVFCEQCKKEAKDHHVICDFCDKVLCDDCDDCLEHGPGLCD